jgi:hypothetical protein
MVGATGEPAAESGPSGVRADLWSLWASPSVLFRSLAGRPRSRGAFLLLVVVITGSTLATLGPLVETMQARGGEELRAEGMDPRALRALESPLARAGMVVLAPLTLTLLLLAYAAAGFLILMLTGGTDAERPFASLWRVAVWSRLVEIPHMLLFVPIALAKGNAEVFFGPAAFFADEPGSSAFRLLAGLDLFAIWFLALLVLGTRIVLRVSAPRAAAAALVPWCAWQLLKLAGTLL